MSESQNNYFNYRQPLSEIHQGTFLRKISSEAFTFLHETAPSCVCFSGYNSSIFIKLSVCDSSLIDWNTCVNTLLRSVVITLPLNYVLRDERKQYYLIFCVGWMRVHRPESLFWFIDATTTTTDRTFSAAKDKKTYLYEPKAGVPWLFSTGWCNTPVIKPCFIHNGKYQ